MDNYFQEVLQGIVKIEPTIVDWEINHNHDYSTFSQGLTTIKFTFLPGTSNKKEEKLTENYMDVFEYSTLLYYECDENQNNQEEQEEMNMYEFEIGDVFVQKNELDNIFSGEAIIVAPGFSIDDFIVNDGVNCINVLVKGDKCPNCGESEITEFNLMLNPNYKVKSKSKKMRDGLLFITVIYDLDDNVEDDCGMEVDIDEELKDMNV